MSKLADPLQLVAQTDLLLLFSRLCARPTATPLAHVPTAAADLATVVRLAGLAEEALPAFTAALAAASSFDPVAWHCDYETTFGPNTVCPVYEAAWVRRERGPLMADIAGFANAFGLQLRSASGERYDHLAAELEIVALIQLMRALALQRGDVESAAIAEDAVDRFVADHLGDWLPGFCAALARLEPHPIWSPLAAALASFWDRCCALHGWTLQAVIAPRNVPPGEREADEPACGMSGACAVEA